MPRKPMKRIVAWSDSRKRDYDTCPLKAFFKHVQRIREPENKAMARGQKIHTEGEEYAIGKRKKLPKSCELFGEEFAELRAVRRRIEREKEYAVDRHWHPCSWFAPETWLRVKADLGYLLDDETYRVIDLKTGKVRPENATQLDIYAPVVHVHQPEHVLVVQAELWYLDWGEIEERRYSRADSLRLQKQWEKETKRMLSDTQFKPTPSRLCAWCWYGQAKKDEGGPGLCEHG
jgi:CRISPR/Cas system-associated exonuclease Cas4 (RecB family)